MSRRLALVIGNIKYEDACFPELKSPGIDIVRLAEVLRSSTMGAFEEVKILVDEPSYALQLAISDFFADKKPDDLLFLYYSGHGAKDSQNRLFLTASNSRHDRLSGSALPSYFITDEMDNSRSKRQILVLDCCYSGAFVKGSKGLEPQLVVTKSTFEGQGYGKVILTATDSLQFAWEGQQVKENIPNSLFTHFIIQGIETGNADFDKDGQITIDEIYQYVFEGISEVVNYQKPQKWIFNQKGEQLIISKNPVIASEANSSNIEFSVKNIICPYCVTEIISPIGSQECPNCKSEIPRSYIHEYDRVSPIYLQLAGYSMVGKSVYLQALSRTISNLDFFWKDFTYSALNSDTARWMQNSWEEAITGQLAHPTQLRLNELCMIQLYNMKRWGNRTLMYRDIAGECFNDARFDARFIPSLIKVPSLLMMVSLKDEERWPENFRMDRLFSTIIDTIGSYDHYYKKKNKSVVVVLSKADLLVPDLPSELTDYLLSDPLSPATHSDKNISIDMKDYLNTMSHISKLIGNWLITINPYARNMVMLATHNNIELRFSIVSALGRQPDEIEHRLIQPHRSARVLDPFFWTLELTSEPHTR